MARSCSFLHIMGAVSSFISNVMYTMFCSVVKLQVQISLQPNPFLHSCLMSSRVVGYLVKQTINADKIDLFQMQMQARSFTQTRTGRPQGSFYIVCDYTTSGHNKNMWSIQCTVYYTVYIYIYIYIYIHTHTHTFLYSIHTFLYNIFVSNAIKV